MKEQDGADASYISKETISYFIYEEEQARNERHIKRLIISLVITILLLFFSNAVWLWAWMQYDYIGEETVSQTVDVDAKDGIANYIGNNGDIVNGESYSKESDNAEKSAEDVKQSWHES